MNGIKLLAAALLMFLCRPASADLFKDPDMSMDPGSFSTAISQFTGFTPNQTTGGGILDLFNDTGQTLTRFALTTFINTGLTLAPNTFVCSTGPSPFFLNCSITYDPSTGSLTTLWSGVNPPDNDPNDAEIGEQEGIPPLLPGCDAQNADTPACAGQGHFAISFNDEFSFTGNTGGWSPTVNPGLFSTAPTFQLVTPEPSGVVLIATALIAIAGIRRLRKRGIRTSNLAPKG
jgi:hypothetical protein